MRAAATTSQGSEFQNFLYAPICHEQEGMTLSVLSALARRDVDPWTEAARLSLLPEAAALKEMTGFLDALPHRALVSLDRAEVAGRLCALLPRRSTTSKLAAELQLQPDSAKAKMPAEKFALNWRFLGIYICLMLLMNWLISQYAAPTSASTEADSPPLVAAEAPVAHPVTGNSVDAAANPDPR